MDEKLKDGCELLETFAARDLEGDRQTTGRIIQQLKSRRFSIQTRQPCPRVGETYPTATTRFEEQSLGVDPGTVVFDLNANEPVPWHGHDFDPARGGVADGVSHGVLDDRLENEVWNLHVEHLGIDANLGGKSILETDGLDPEIPVQELDLLLKCHFHRPGILQRETQEVAETRDHLAGGLGVPGQQSRDRMQRVEKKVRVDLHLQRFQLRLHELGVKLRGLQLVSAVTVVVVERMAHQQDEPINESPMIKVVVEKIEHPERCD